MRADNLKEITTSLNPGIYLLDELSEDGIVKLAGLMKLSEVLAIL